MRAYSTGKWADATVTAAGSRDFLAPAAPAGRMALSQADVLPAPKAPTGALGEPSMNRLALASLLLSLAIPGLPAAAPESARTHEIKLNGHTFTLPIGFEIEL